MEGLEGSALDGLILRNIRWVAPKNKEDKNNKRKPKRNGSRKNKSLPQKTNSGAA